MKGAYLEALGAIKKTLTGAKDAGVPILTTVTGVLLILITAVEALEANKEQVKELIDRLRRLVEAVIQPILSAKQANRETDGVVHSFNGISLDLEDRIEKMSIKLKTIQDDIAKLDSRNTFRRMIAHETVSAALAAASKKIGEAADDFLVEGDITKEMMIYEIKQGTKQTREEINAKLDSIKAQNDSRMLSEDVERLINSLPRAHAQFNAKSKGDTSSCWPGTRLQVLEEIYQWEMNDGNECPRVFWLTGLAGAGKTTIARTVASTLDKAGRLGGSFFFSRLEGGDRAQAESLFTTIAWQLAQFHSSFRTSIAQSLHKKPNSGHNTTPSQFETLITTPFSQAVDPPARVTIVIDALDECSTDDPHKVEEILELLLMVPKFSFQVKFFLTSRPEYHIRDHLLYNVHVRPLVLQRISPSIVQGDIRLFLRESLRKIGRTRLRDEAWPNEEDLNALAEMSGELFIFASTAIKYIHGDRFRNRPKQNLEILLKSKQDDGQSRLKESRSPYHDIDQLYLQVLRNSVPEDADMDDSAFIRDIVGTIILLRQPLSVIAISYLVEVDIDKLSSDLELLSSVFDVPEDNEQPITIIHPSFVDFLTSSGRCTDPRFFIDRNVHESRLAGLCLDHINNSLSVTTFGDCHGETLANLVQMHDGLCPTMNVLAKSQIRKWHPPQMRYVCIFLDSHLGAQGTQPGCDLAEKMRYFWSTMLTEWVRYYIAMEPPLFLNFGGIIGFLEYHQRLQQQLQKLMQQEIQQEIQRMQQQRIQQLQLQLREMQMQQMQRLMQAELRRSLVDMATHIHGSSSQEQRTAVRSADLICSQLLPKIHAKQSRGLL